MMKTKKQYSIKLLIGVLCLSGAAIGNAGVLVQCPTGINGNAVSTDPAVKCMHLTAGDGFATMGDGTTRYIFGFADVSAMETSSQLQKDAVITTGILAHQWPAPTIELNEGQEFYLSLTNVGMLIRPDLFDAHTIHFHGYPQSSTVFDGLPESGVSINMGSTLTYYFKLNDPGTYMYHCHVEATEHMQMGMLGNLYIKPLQNQLPNASDLNGFTHQTGFQYAYNDGDGSTFYDVEYPIQLGSFDGAFHDASESVQPLPFALMRDDYPMINGRGYPHTADAREDTFPPTPGSAANADNPQIPTAQQVSSLIQANPGEKILLRISNLAITRYYTLQSPGIKMKVVGRDAKLLRAPNGSDLYYETNSVTLGGGESIDVILDTTGLNSGTYVLYTSNLNYLSNAEEPFGGMMTEIVIN
ncbi:MAG: multicopper oxidase domain-containing protein [Gammaproteobacteria bacterium]|nr:multicopper oxidase domain-containing protein [Gammaproteobacteria bacterium]